jgi:hypothetical protein
MLVRLTRKLADRIDGVDLTSHSVGDVFEVALHAAQLLITEGWAVPFEGEARVRSADTSVTPAPKESTRAAASLFAGAARASGSKGRRL